jgi:UPF0042 nucleotide-binding protein
MADETRLIIVSGLSGSGKTVALHVLEDLGFYCIDNMPAALLGAVVAEVRSGSDAATNRIAVGVDARNRSRDLDALPEHIAELERNGISTELLFLQASDEVLIKRYSESRRRHPLDESGTSLQSAIQSERELLAEVVNSADLIIDTSHTSVYELADAIRERVNDRRPDRLSVLIESFGFKNGIPADADFVFDLRCLPNPYWIPDLRSLTGKDEDVIKFLDAQDEVRQMYEDILSFLSRWIPHYDDAHRSYLTIALGCTGGQHRSVYMAERLGRALHETHEPVLTRHNELLSHPIRKQ